MKIIALHDKVLVKPDPVEKKTAGGIIIPDMTADRQKYAQMKGKVVSYGDVAFTHADGDGWRDKPQPGDRIMFGKYAGVELVEDDEEYRMIRDEDVTARLA